MHKVRPVGLAALSLMLVIGPNGPTTASFASSDAARSDPAASQLAQDERLTYDEALRRVERQERVAALATALTAQLPDKFGLLWTDQANGGTIVVNRVGRDDRFQRAVTRAGLNGEVRFEDASVSLTRLNAAFAEIETSLESVQSEASPLGFSLDAVNNRVTVDSVPAVPFTPQQQQWYEDLRNRHGDAVGRAEQAQGTANACAWPTCDPPLRGGLWASTTGTNSGGFCTTGFIAQSKTDAARKFFITAGHCTSSTWYGRFVSDGAWRKIGTRHVNSYYGSNGDASLITVDSNATWAPQGIVYVRPSAGAYPTTENASYSIKALGAANVGDYVCHTGATLGTRCGKVEAASTSTTYKDGVTVGNLARVKYTACQGDSGGPVYRSNTAFGIHSGSLDDAGTKPTPNGGTATCGFTSWYALINPVLVNLNVNLTAGP